jgi:TonB family protein
MRSTLLALTALAMGSAPAFAAEPVVIPPNGGWNLDYADEKCLLTRMFGEGKNAHFLAFQQYWPARDAGVTVAGAGFDRFRSRAPTAVRFFDTQEPMETTPFTGDVQGYGRGVIFSRLYFTPQASERDADDTSATAPVLPQLDTAVGQQVQFIELTQGGRTVRLETGPMDAALDALNQCSLDLMRQWGLDPERHLTAQSGPRWLNEDALTRRIVADYPRDAVNQGEQGIMRMRVIVADNGRVESCTIINATKTDRLESPACAVMQRATFEPARDANGVAFRSLFATTITYQIGERRPGSSPRMRD